MTAPTTTPAPPPAAVRPAVLREVAWGLGAFAVLVALWALLAATGVLGSSFVGPAETVATLAGRWDIVSYNAVPTLQATVTGAVILLVVTAVGLVAVGCVPGLAPWLVSLGIVAGSLPLISVTPVLSSVIPMGTPLMTTVTVLSGLVPVAAMLGTIPASAQRGRAELGALYDAGRFRWWRHVGVWRSVPALDIGLRAMLPACFVGAIVAEWSGAAGDRGLGGLMANSLYSFQAPLLWACILLATVVALALLAAVTLLMLPLRLVVR